MNHIRIGNGKTPSVIFLHGWARTHKDFIPAAESLAPHATSLLLDMPGFGDTPRPDSAWTTGEYADHVAGFIRERTTGPVVIVGHSFGGRVGLRLAVRHPELLSGLVVVAGAGIPARRSLLKHWRGKLRQTQFRILRGLARDEQTKLALEARFGSPDYVQSRELGLRDIFLSAIREDQSPDLPRIKAKTVLLYGALDTETPPDMGRRIGDLIPGSRFVVLPEFDHLSILSRGRHIIGVRAKELVDAP